MRSFVFGAPVLASALFDQQGATCGGFFEHDTDYHTGQDLGSVDAADETECCQKCGETAECKFFTFVSGSDRGGCWLKRGRSGVRSFSGAISGGIAPITTTTTTTAAPVTEPVKVFILMGQSNMLGEGEIEGQKDGTLEYAVQEKGLYQYLVEDGQWRTLDHLRNVFIMGSADNAFEKSTLHHNEFMTVDSSHKKTIGPELGIGFTLANYSVHPTMTLKSCIGNRALGWDLLVPGSQQFEYTDKSGKTWIYAGYHDSPNRWEKGTTPQPISWTAGIQWDGDTARAQHILDDLDTFYPGASQYEVAGFFWWQGDKDSRDMALAERYEFNLVNLIKTLRKTFNAPNAKFVTASLGQTEMGATDGGGKILDAMLAVDGKSGKYPEFVGNVAAVYTHPLSKGGSSGAHYNKNAETYMNIGEAMGAAMVELLKGDAPASLVV